jgi:hypothetical protein
VHCAAHHKVILFEQVHAPHAAPLQEVAQRRQGLVRPRAAEQQRAGDEVHAAAVADGGVDGGVGAQNAVEGPVATGAREGGVVREGKRDSPCDSGVDLGRARLYTKNTGPA